MFRVNNFDKLLDKATSNLRLDPDWPTILQICDLIRQNDCTPKYAVAAVKKKLYSQNPHQAMFALLTLESIVKNCGSGVHDEVGSKVFCESLRDLVKTTQHENLRSKILELIQAWAFAFRNSSKYRAVQDTVNILKTEGYKFPPLKESDAMFSADTAPEWADGEVCHRCRVAFSLMVRRHHCRACGQVFCQQCSSKTSTLPKFGIEKEVRVCDACYDKVSRPPTSSAKLDIIDTSSDYGPTATPQKRPGKSEEELREEEELQLALALSQSEAEQKEKERRTRTHIAPDPAPLHTISPTPSSVSASPDHGSSANAELSRYLDRSYWEQRLSRDTTAPTAPVSNTTNEAAEEIHQTTIAAARTLVPGAWRNTDFTKPATCKSQDDDNEDKEIDEFVESLKSQVEIFVNRMKSNSSRGRSIANDTSVQTLFMNITAMHSRLLRYIQQQDDKRVYLESLQDKVNQVRDSRAALDTLRAEHAARLAAQAEAAERQRQMQMAAKLQAMRKKKHEYLQYQRQLALQRVQEQEREMQMRQEQQKHQYMMANNYYLPGVSMHQFQPGFPSQPIYASPQFHPQMMPQATSEGAVPMPGQPQMSQANMQMGALSQSMPQLNNSFAMSTPGMALTQPSMSAQSPMTQNMRAALSQQLPMQQQMLLQQMQQMRMPSQAAMHQLMTQNGLPGQTLPQNPSGQQLAKQNLANQPQQQQSAMMPPLTSAQQSMGQPMMISSNPGFGVHMQNMRMPMIQGNQPTNQQVPGYPLNMPNQQNTQQSISQPNMQQPNQMGIQGQQITLPGQQITLPGQQITLPGQQITSQSNQLPGQQAMHVPNQMPVSQSMPVQGSQVPQPQQHMQSQSQAVVGQLPGQQMQPPGQQMVMQGQQISNQAQNIPQGQQVMNNQIPQAQMPGQTQQQGQLGPGMAQSVTQPSQMPPQGPQVSQGQHLPQIQQISHGQQMMQGQPMPQGQQMTQGQQIPQGQQMTQGQQMSHVPQMPQGQQMPPSHSQGQQMPQGQAIPQNMQPGKMQSQNFGNGPPAQGGQTNQQPQTPVKSKANSTAELITFD